MLHRSDVNTVSGPDRHNGARPQTGLCGHAQIRGDVVRGATFKPPTRSRFARKFVILHRLQFQPEAAHLSVIATGNDAASANDNHKPKMETPMTNRIIALAAAALIGSATLASASINAFDFSRTVAASDTLDIGLVRATDAGSVEIYNVLDKEFANALGTTEINPGANRDVRVDVGFKPQQDVVAVLRVNGEIVATQQLSVSR